MINALAGLFYLLNKIFFACAEISKGGKRGWEKRFKISAWVTYIIGLGPWLIVFSQTDDWIAFWVELAGLPSMVLGLINSIRNRDQEEPTWLVYVALFITAIGCLISFQVLNGFHEFTQLLEFVLAIGFLGGTFLLCRKNPIVEGYLCFVVMNASNAWLQSIRGNDLLMKQQTFSLTIMLFVYWLTQWRRWKRR